MISLPVTIMLGPPSSDSPPQAIMFPYALGAQPIIRHIGLVLFRYQQGDPAPQASRAIASLILQINCSCKSYHTSTTRAPHRRHVDDNEDWMTSSIHARLDPCSIIPSQRVTT